ncbi:hypothetical protein AZ005_001974, partial [Escherichia coli]
DTGEQRLTVVKKIGSVSYTHLDVYKRQYKKRYQRDIHLSLIHI